VPIKPKDGLVGFVSFVLDNALHLSSIGIVTRPQGGYRLTYPTRKSQKGSFHIFYPINKETAECIEQAVIARFEEVTKSYVRYHSTYTKRSYVYDY
jgi:DNA-binding cell septation regulator SpoVG